MIRYAYVFRRDFDNPGDLYSSIMHYLFPDKAGIMIDVYDNKVPKIEVDTVFVGGGAIFSTNKFIHSINDIMCNINAKHKIVWGVGINPNLKKEIKPNFDLFGVRDYGLTDHTWTPCPSVLHPEIIKNLEVKPTKDFLIIDHWKRPIEFEGECTRVNNKPNNIHNIVSLIADHRYVLTSSYHAAYWATLLRKKTFVIGELLPGKFYTMKHSPLIASEFSYELLDQATVYDNAFEECIVATNEFKTRVENLTGQDFTFQHSNRNLRDTFDSEVADSSI